MVIDKAKKIVLAVGTTMLPVSIAGALFAGSTNLLSPTHASAYTITLNNSNSPELTNGEGTNDIDEKGIIWEYHNASDNNNGHVTLGHQGYFGVTTSGYDYKGIDNIVANFTAGEGAELWLLASYNGSDWNEVCQLTSGKDAIAASGWRYVRFYCWDESNNLVNVESVTLGYSCEGITNTEDIDSARLENVVSVSPEITATEETENISPLGNSTRAIRFTKSGSASTNVVIAFNRQYTVADIAYQKVEFDLKGFVGYDKTIELVNGTAKVGTSISSKQHSSYKITNIQDDWYHIEVPITAFVSLISGYADKDVPAKDIGKKVISGVKLNCGEAIIDNLRISGEQCEMGIFNSPSWKPKVGEFYWFKVSWVGKVHPELVQMTFSDDTLARHIPLSDPNLKNGSPFYIELLGAGSLTITCTVVVGYNRQTIKTVSNTITITE